MTGRPILTDAEIDCLMAAYSAARGGAPPDHPPYVAQILDWAREAKLGGVLFKQLMQGDILIDVRDRDGEIIFKAAKP